MISRVGQVFCRAAAGSVAPRKAVCAGPHVRESGFFIERSRLPPAAFIPDETVK
jgi:hypothetical protein